MKPNLVVDEMFPEGAGSYMDLDEVSLTQLIQDFFLHDYVVYFSILWEVCIWRFFFPTFHKMSRRFSKFLCRKSLPTCFVQA